MGVYFVYIPNSVRKLVKKFPKDWRLKIVEKLRKLESEPFLGVTMQGKYSNKRKIVVWPYRIVYKVHEEKMLVEILEIQTRGNMSYDK